jgi:hypothetical protein
MRVAHIILTHKNPVQLARLIKTMQHPQFDFYIHADTKIRIDDLKDIEQMPNVKLIKNRIECNWGGFTLLKAIFNSLSEVLSSGIDYGFINLLSAQDYPITTPQKIYEFLLEKKGKNFISFDESHNSEWWKNASNRYEKYHFTDLKIKGKFFLERILNMFMPSRKFPEYSTLYGGNKSTWWTISTDCAIYLCEKFYENTKLHKFLQFCWGTDEFVIPTFIMNSHFKDHVVNDNLRYIDWSEGKASPKLFDLSDFEKISSSNMLFARKFDSVHNEAILDKIDEQLLTDPKIEK